MHHYIYCQQVFQSHLHPYKLNEYPEKKKQLIPNFTPVIYKIHFNPWEAPAGNHTRMKLHTLKHVNTCDIRLLTLWIKNIWIKEDWISDAKLELYIYSIIDIQVNNFHISYSLKITSTLKTNFRKYRHTHSENLRDKCHHIIHSEVNNILFLYKNTNLALKLSR